MLLSSIWFWISSLFWPSYEKGLLPVDANRTQFTLIGAGLQRTGTFSTRIALSKLLKGKCYHGFTGSMGGDDDFWLEAAHGRVTEADWHDFLLGQGYVAGVGEPISLFYEDLMRVFPDAKILLTTRPADAWYHSMQKAIIEPRGFLERPPISWVFDYFGIVHAKKVMEDTREQVRKNRGLNHTSWTAVEAGKETAMRFFEDWNAKVIATVPKEKLLVYDVREGWEPLCDFLGLPVPDEPYPRLNDYGTIEWIVKGSYYGVFVVLPILLVVLVLWRSKRAREMAQPLFKVLMKCLQPCLAIVNSQCINRKKTKAGYSPLKQKA